MASDLKDDPFSDEGNELDFKLFENLKSARIKEGYREGIIAGKEADLQLGFDKGRQIGIDAAYRLGKLRGALRAIVCNIRLTQSSGNVKIDELDVKCLQDAEGELSDLHDKLKSNIISKSVPETFNQVPTSVVEIRHEILNCVKTELNEELDRIICRCRQILLKLDINVSILEQ